MGLTTVQRDCAACDYFLYPWVYSSQELKAKKVKIKAGVTIGPERRRSRKCRAKEQN